MHIVLKFDGGLFFNFYLGDKSSLIISNVHYDSFFL